VDTSSKSGAESCIDHWIWAVGPPAAHAPTRRPVRTLRPLESDQDRHLASCCSSSSTSVVNARTVAKPAHGFCRSRRRHLPSSVRARPIGKRYRGATVLTAFRGVLTGAHGRLMAEDVPSHQVTLLLRQLGDGRREALNELVPLVYGELRRMARRQLSRERVGHTLDSGALVNEAFLKLVGDDELALQTRAHFFGISANAMRRILVDHARAHTADKRGGGARQVSLDEAEIALPTHDAERLLALDDALNRLAAIDDEAVKLVEQRYFAGATEEEAARALGISPATARRRWAFAKAWLQRELSESVLP
jgi:RNA polymerase sigma factor (TIGR02999 family)